MMHRFKLAMSVLRQPFVSSSASISTARLGSRHFTDDASASANHPAKPSHPDQIAEKECQTSQRASTTASADNRQPRYRRLIRRRYMDPIEACSDPDLLGDDVPGSVWYLKLYGPDIEVITDTGVPSGWILVDHPDPPPEKVEKKWDRFDFKDPNWSINIDRARWRKPPIDYYNMGYTYTYDRNDPTA